MTELAVGQKIKLSDERNGTIRYVGQTAFAPGIWVGIELDDGSGKNDGSVQGERYFDCAMGYGMFVRPTTVTVIAQPPPPQRPAGRRPTSRPSSMFSSGSGRGSAPVDSGLNKRRSLNAPSPSPVPRQSRSGSVRVSFSLSKPLPRNLTATPAVPDKVSHEAAGYRAVERSHVPDRHALQCQTRTRSEAPSRCRTDSGVHGTPVHTSSQTSPPGHSCPCAKDGRPCATPERAAFISAGKAGSDPPSQRQAWVLGLFVWCR